MNSSIICANPEVLPPGAAALLLERVAVDIGIGRDIWSADASSRLHKYITPLQHNKMNQEYRLTTVDHQMTMIED